MTAAPPQSTALRQSQASSAGAAASSAGSPAQAAVALDALTLRYGERTALDAIHLTVSVGEQFALLGPNGSGKSTLLRILSSLLRPTSGTAAIGGADVFADPAAARRRLGVVFQGQGLDAKLTVAENLRFHGHLHGLGGRALRERVDVLLERFALTERRRDRAGTLSGGLRRRVELAKALLHRPQVLLLDEPSSGLDLPSRQAFWQTLEEWRRQDALTVLVATHLMDEAERCGRVALLDQGRLVALDSPAALKRALGDVVLTVESPDPAALLQRLEQQLGLEGAVEDGVLRLKGGSDPALAPRLLAEFPTEVTAVRVGRPTLADVFLARTGHAMAEVSAPTEAP